MSPGGIEQRGSPSPCGSCKSDGDRGDRTSPASPPRAGRTGATRGLHPPSRRSHATPAARPVSPRAPPPRAHRHRCAALRSAAPAATRFRAKSSPRDPPEPGKSPGITLRHDAAPVCVRGRASGPYSLRPRPRGLRPRPRRLLELGARCASQTRSRAGAACRRGGLGGPAPPTERRDLYQGRAIL